MVEIDPKDRSHNPLAGLDEDEVPKVSVQRLTNHMVEMMDRMRRRTSKGEKFR